MTRRMSTFDYDAFFRGVVAANEKREQLASLLVTSHVFAGWKKRLDSQK
jgi:hypothetical protein